MSQRMNLITSGYGVYEESYSTTCHWITFKLPHTVFDTDKKRHELCSGVFQFYESDKIYTRQQCQGNRISLREKS